MTLAVYEKYKELLIADRRYVQDDELLKFVLNRLVNPVWILPDPDLEMDIGL